MGLEATVANFFWVDTPENTEIRQPPSPNYRSTSLPRCRTTSVPPAPTFCKQLSSGCGSEARLMTRPRPVHRNRCCAQGTCPIQQGQRGLHYTSWVTPPANPGWPLRMLSCPHQQVPPEGAGLLASNGFPFAQLTDGNALYNFSFVQSDQKRPLFFCRFPCAVNHYFGRPTSPPQHAR